jgi:hypothetical protein
MRVYHERLRAPFSWWLLGLATMLLLATEVVAGWAWPARLPLDAVGEVSALDEAQTRSLRGPRGDPAAFLMLRPYLRHAVYVEVARPGAETRQARRRLRVRGLRLRVEVTRPVLDSPYWLVCTRHPVELAAAINGARAATPAGGATMG